MEWMESRGEQECVQHYTVENLIGIRRQTTVRSVGWRNVIQSHDVCRSDG